MCPHMVSMLGPVRPKNALVKRARRLHRRGHPVKTERKKPREVDINLVEDYVTNEKADAVSEKNCTMACLCDFNIG